jgi:hypothetical protein
MYLAVSALVGAGVIAAGCANGNGDTFEAASGAGGASSSVGHGPGASTGTGGDDIDILPDGGTDGALDPETACAAQSAKAELVKKPVDVIIFIDNSGSMEEEILGVQANINKNFADIIEQSGIDYRVILVSRHGSASGNNSVCIEAPLSGIPQGGCATPPKQPVNNPSKFYHYSTKIESRDAWCKVFTTWNKPDSFKLAPNGWVEWLRPEAFKSIIILSDDGIGCNMYSDGNNVDGGQKAAALFDKDLLALSPAHFGTAAARNYRYYSIVAMAFNNPPDKPYAPADPVTAAICPTAANPGTGHQALSVLTGGLRFPLCDTTSYDSVFQAIAAGVVEGAKVQCDFTVPEAPDGSTIDLKTVIVEYLPGNNGQPSQYKQIEKARQRSSS